MSLCPLYIFKYPDTGKSPFKDWECDGDDLDDNDEVDGDGDDYDEGLLEGNMLTYLDEIMENLAPIDSELLELAKALNIEFPLTPPELANGNELEFQDFNCNCFNHEMYVESCKKSIPNFSYDLYKNLDGYVANPYICLTPWYRMCLFDLDIFKSKVAELELTVIDYSFGLLYSPFLKPLGWRD